MSMFIITTSRTGDEVRNNKRKRDMKITKRGLKSKRNKDKFKIVILKRIR
jgi:hypothetical protein